MSLHAKSSPEVEAQLEALKRNSTISSIIIALLLTILIGIVLMTIALISVGELTPQFTSYVEPQEDHRKLKKQEVKPRVQRLPASSSSSISRVITVNINSDVSIPTPDIDVPESTANFGLTNEMGEGWEAGWGTDGDAPEGEPDSFFPATVGCQRICYVIDFSASMKKGKIKLLRSELERSIAGLVPGTHFQLIFFAGPAWTVGDMVVMGDKKKEAVVRHRVGPRELKDYKWVSKGRSDTWEQDGTKQRPKWMKATESNINYCIEAVRDTPLVWGTVWEAPLMMAMSMEPKPDTIVFLTDGTSGDKFAEVARKLGIRAKNRNIRVNTVALMVPEARRELADIARRSGGEFHLVDATGKVHKQDLNDPKNK